MSNDMSGLILKKNLSPVVGLVVERHLVVGQYSSPAAVSFHTSSPPHILLLSWPRLAYATNPPGAPQTSFFPLKSSRTEMACCPFPSLFTVPQL